MKNRTKWILGCIILVLMVMGLLLAFVSSVFGPSVESIVARLNKIGVERIEQEAMELINAGKKDSLDPRDYPSAISKLRPHSVRVVDSELVVIVLKEFNGTSETGVYVYKDSSTPRRRNELRPVTKTLAIYKMFD